MALANYTVAGLGGATPVFAPTSAEPLRVPLDDLLYSPADHQPDAPAQHPSHEPFAPPSSHAPQRRSKLRKRAGSQYLPPPNQYQHYPRPEEVPHNPYGGQLHAQVYQHQHQQNTRLDISIENQRVHEVNAQYDNTGQYIHDPTGDYDYEQRRTEGIQRAGYRPGYSEPPYPPATTPSPLPSRRFDGTQNTQNVNYNFVNVPVTSPSPLPPQPLLPQPLQPQPLLPQPLQPQSLPQRPLNEPSRNAGGSSQSPSQNPPDRPPGFTKVEPGGGPGSKTQLHAVLDYDDDYYDDVPGPGASQPAVTPLQGPILLRNGTVPVVPLTSYQTVNNGSFYQIPILWTALSLALGYELQGQIIKGVPCVKRNFQLYCPTAGNTYPLDKIETFIDENKALIKRMYGSFATPGGSRVRRAPGVPDVHEPGVPEADGHAGESFFRHARQARQSSSNAPLPDPQSVNSTGRIDACESKTEIMTPYWALNSARKLRAIVNTMHFEQAIHQEVCSKKSTSRCSGDCGCEQKYKWHRLLAYDPNDDCAGIFMDWFLFPSCCVCRCNP